VVGGRNQGRAGRAQTRGCSHSKGELNPNELAAYRRRVNRLMVDFVKMDVAVGLTVAKGAHLNLDNLQSASRAYRNARKTYDTVLTLIGKVVLTEYEARELEYKLHRLRSALIELGELLKPMSCKPNMAALRKALSLPVEAQSFDAACRTANARGRWII